MITVLVNLRSFSPPFPFGGGEGGGRLLKCTQGGCRHPLTFGWHLADVVFLPEDPDVAWGGAAFFARAGSLAVALGC